MNRRHFLATGALVALAGCSAQPEPTAATPAEGPPPAGAKLVVLKLPGMT
jgi:nitrous oxide reductase